jgi:hypothetical protein
MRSEKRLWAPLTLLLVLVALLAPQSATASSSVGMAVDAIPGGPVDASAAVTVGTPFDVDIVITDASTPYQGYGYKLQWDPAVVAFDGVTQLKPADLTLCAAPVPSQSTVYAACGRTSDTTTFTGPVDRVTMHCVSNGISALHLVTRAENPAFGSSALGEGGVHIEAALADATIDCGGVAPGPTSTPGQGPTATPPGGTPPPPGATPTPLPPGYEAVDLAGGCNPVATTYPDGTPIGTIAGAVGPAGNLEALWEFEGAVWFGYSPAYPQASDLTAKDFLDVVFICVMGPGQFVRPIV